MLKVSVRFLLFVTFGLVVLQVQGFGQQSGSCPRPPCGLIVKIPDNANIEVVAAHLAGGVADRISNTPIFLLSVPAAPANNGPDNDAHWKEINRATTLDSGTRPKYLQLGSETAADWYKTQPCFARINLAPAQTISTGRGVVVADLNSRVDYAHPALLGHLTSGYDFVIGKPIGVAALNDESSAGYLDDESSAGYLDQATAAYLLASGAGYLNDESSAGYLDQLNPAISHGTLTAGVIVAIAPDAMVMPVRVFDDNGSSNLFMIAKGIRWAVEHGAQVINMSFGVDSDSPVLRHAIDFALDRNVILTTSAGNSNTSVSQIPAAYPGVLTVGATNNQDVKAAFSNYGPTIDINSCGVNIILPFPGNLYALVSGTSFSAPAIAGTAALLLEAQSATTSVETRIDAGGVNIDALNPAYAGQLGHGRIDILRAVQSP